MKLFQRLLVAPAALGLMAPIAANADTAFSSTTTIGGSAFFTTGSVSFGTDPAEGEADNPEEMYMQYAYGLNVSSSFTGEDLLSADFMAGNANGPLLDMDSADDSTGNLSVDSLWYSFPVGGITVTTGPVMAQDAVVAASGSVYSDDFRHGAMPFSLAGREVGPGVAVSYEGDNGLVASVSFISDQGDVAEQGINTDEGDDVTTLSIGYTGDGFGLGFLVSSNDGDVDDVASPETNTFGVGANYSPDALPATFSIAYDTADAEWSDLDAGGDDVEITDLFIGVDYEVGPGTLSVAWHSTDIDTDDDDDDISGYEVSYTVNVNDNVTVSPGIFSEEDGNGEEDTGLVVETAFSF